MALLLALAGSIIDSVILVTVKSRLTGIKFLTPEIRFSKLALKFAPRFPPMPDSWILDVILDRPPSLLPNPPNRLPEFEVWGVDCEGAEVIIVIRVVARTLRGRLACLLDDVWLAYCLT